MYRIRGCPCIRWMITFRAPFSTSNLTNSTFQRKMELLAMIKNLNLTVKEKILWINLLKLTIIISTKNRSTIFLMEKVPNFIKLEKMRTKFQTNEPVNILNLKMLKAVCFLKTKIDGKCKCPKKRYLWLKDSKG